ncbi:hypothetical protein F5Y14DRAFT_399935 [Nemania sp. NC0429]|nr:hypothetical protein F5Y14DRAFT_399935 [Nemania sp. NC0429]
MGSTIARQSFNETIKNIDSAITSYQAVKNEGTLGDTFHRAVQALSPAVRVLRKLPPESLVYSLEPCSRLASGVKNILNAVQSSSTSVLEAYEVAIRKATMQAGYEVTVEGLVIRIIQCVCERAEGDKMEPNIADEVRRLRDTMNELSKMAPSRPKEGSPINANAYGEAHQFIAARDAIQHNNTGAGNQLNGGHFNGPLNFGAPAPPTKKAK